MPFEIIRNDITKVKADVIVNTANPKPIYASGTLKVLVFSTVKAAERELFPRFGHNFKEKCLRCVEEFYSCKEYQLKIHFLDEEEELYNDHILRPIVLLVSLDGRIEEVLSHKELLKMEVYPLKSAYRAVELDRRRRFHLEGIPAHCSLK